MTSSIRNKAWALLPYAALLLAALPLMLWRDFTPDNELRYLSIADEAIREGHLFTFYNHGIAYADKPPLYLWLTMIARAICGDNCMWLLTLFSLIPAMITARVAARMATPLLPGRSSTLAAWMLFTTAFFTALAVTVRMDMLMTMFITLAISKFAAIAATDGPLPARSRRTQAWLGLWVFLGVFAKGPMGILVPLVPTLVWALWTGRLRAWGRAWGAGAWAVILAGCAIWWGGVALEGGAEYLNNLLFHQTVDRAVDAFHHKRPAWFYLVNFWYIAAPWSLAFAAAIIAAARRGMLGSNGLLMRLMLTIVVVTIAMLSCFSSKVDVYLLPALPFMVMFTVAVIAAYGRQAPWYMSLAIALPAVALVAGAVAVLSGLFSIPVATAPEDWIIICAPALLGIGGLLSIICLLRKRMPGAVISLAAGMLAAVLVAGFALPELNAMIGYGEVARKASQPGVERVVTYGVRRAENIDVYTGGRPVLIATDRAGLDSLMSLPGRSALIMKETDATRDTIALPGEYENVYIWPYIIKIKK